jgi:hypothetical protein
MKEFNLKKELTTFNLNQEQFNNLNINFSSPKGFAILTYIKNSDHITQSKQNYTLKLYVNSDITYKDVEKAIVKKINERTNY